MKLSKMICFALLASLPLATFAASRSSSVQLAGGIAAPGQALTIESGKLYENVFYDVSCNIRMESKGDILSHIQVVPHNAGFIEVNYRPIPNNGQALITTNEDNPMVVHEARSYTSFDIVNLDQDNTLTVSDCVATPGDY